MKVTYEWESVFGPVALVLDLKQPLTAAAERRVAGHVADLDEMVSRFVTDEEPF